MSTQIELDEDDPLDATSDYTEEYERYLSNLENSYDICISIDFIRQRLALCQKSIDNNFEDISDDILDSQHCYHLLSIVLPKSVEFLCKTDLNNLYDQDIIQYQKINCNSYTTNSAECREFLVNKIESYFEFIIQFILNLKPNYQKEFYDVLKDIFLLTHRLYKPHAGFIDRLSTEYRQQIMNDCSGKYAECTQITIKQYHPNYIKLINYFGQQSGFTIILQEMLDGKSNNKNKNKQENNDTEGDNDEHKDNTNTIQPDRPPSTLTHHSLQCYITSLACIHRFLIAQIKQQIAEYMYQAVEHWYMSMSIKSLKQYPRSQVHAILKKLYYLISNCSMREEYVSKFEYLRLEIAYRWLCTDSLERKITAWKEFKEYIETTQRKYDIINNPHKYSSQQLSSYSYCKNPKRDVAIYYINCRDVANFLHNKNVLNLFLAEDVHEELLKKSFDILYFLGWYNLLDSKYILQLWNHSIEKTESFVNTVYKVIIDLFTCLKWELIEYILDLIIDIPLNIYNNAIIDLISSFCNKCLYRAQLNNNNTITVPQKIAEWHCGLKLLWRAMQSERSHNEYNIPLANQDIQQLSMTKLVMCLQSDYGAVHQEYCKNLCVENLRCSRSVGTSLRVLQNIINAHPIIPPPPPPNQTNTPQNQNKMENQNQNQTQISDEIKENNKENIEEDEEAEDEKKIGDNGSYFSRESTRSEIIHSLEKHHGILNLFFQDLSRYMSAYNPQSINHPMNQQEHKESEGNKQLQPRQIVNFRARFDFLRFILQYSSLRLSNKQLNDLWNIVIGETLKIDYSIPYSYKLEQNYFFKWLKDICPPLNLNTNTNTNANYSPAISVDDAVNLFHSKLGSMPRRTMTSDSLQCLHQYFDLVYELATKKSATSGVTAHPDLSAALDVMWEIAIEAETDTVAQSCGVFILSFYMKPAVHQNHIQQQQNINNNNQSNIQNKVSDNILNLINNVNNTNQQQVAQVNSNNNNINKWEGRTNFVEKCMDYIQQQSVCNNYRAVHRCLDLLETFIECTRPGVMRGEIMNENSAAGGTGDDESSSDSVIYMGDNSDANNTNKKIELDFKKTSPWDLGKYNISYWRLPIGLNHFIVINISNLQMQKDTKNFKIMMNKYSRVCELKDLISAILNQDKNLLQMQANNNISLTPQIESQTLESCNLRDGCIITVMSIFSLGNGNDNGSINNSLKVNDGAFILSQNRLYIEILLDLLSTNKKTNDCCSRIWYLLMRLPFNLQVIQSLKDIKHNAQEQNKEIMNNINWNIFIDSSSTFKLLYSLQIFDSVLFHCSSQWLDSFMMLNGLQHLYYTLINFKFDYNASAQHTYASFRVLYMLLKIFSNLTSHELIESDPLYTRSKPRHNIPKILRIKTVSGTLSKFNHNELDVLKLGNKIFELIFEILSVENIENNNLLSEIIELALYLFISLLFFYSSRLSELLNKYWCNLLSQLLFVNNKLIRQISIKYLYQIFVKYKGDYDIHNETLELLYKHLEEKGEVYFIEYFEFYSYIIKYYCSHIIYFDNNLYSQTLLYFQNGPLKYTYNSLINYVGNDNEYLLGLLLLLKHIFISLPTLKQHCLNTILRPLKTELIINCLFSVPDPFDSPLDNIRNKNKGQMIPKCQTFKCRNEAFNLLLELARNNIQLWNEILFDFTDIHNRRMNDIGDDISFGFSPSYLRRSVTTNLCGLNNYGCTCYMNATMQQLYCNPIVRKIILGTDIRKLGLNKTSVFYAMQTMFCNLLWSDRRAIWPEDFLQNYRDFEGNKIDPNEQMDAHEFFNFLFDNLERELGGTIAEQILKNEFCGKEVNQVICQECGYVSETFVPMYAVSCKIQSHQTLEESLEYEFVRGDWLKGGNAYRCSKCDKKVTALKRSCFTQLSNTMLVHLQRFEFNLETMLKVKINSELRFPLSLNMNKYTKEYLDTGECDENYEYELVGITVHSGMADIGHYYSFIRQQLNNGSLGKWYSFNDDYVTNFDSNINNISDKCFGGNKLTLIRDSKTNQLVQRWIAKSNNAYILVYRRKNLQKKIENMLIDDQYLTIKEYKLNELKANNNKPPVPIQTVTIQESTTATATATAGENEKEPIIKEPPDDINIEPHNNEQQDGLDDINIGHSLELDEELNEIFEQQEEEKDKEQQIEEVKEQQHHLYDIAETIHWNNTRFTKKCQLCDINLVDFQWKFFNLQHNKYSNILPKNRYKSYKIRSNIGNPRTKLILYFVWDILCKFDTATKIPHSQTNDNKDKDSREKNKKLTQIYSWCEFIKELFSNDIESAYQFLYIITHTKKRYWCKYLLETKNVLVRECFVNCLIHAIKCLINLERPLYYLYEQDEEEEDEKDEIIEINRNKKDEFVEWFKSASVIAHVLDEMCRLILLATNYWRLFNEFWLFFKLFAELGNLEKQLLLDRHLIIECFKFYNNKKPYEYGLKQLILEDGDLDESGRKIKYDRRKMGSNDSEPNVSNMIHMLSLIICSCCPPNLKSAINNIPKINKFSDIILPYSTMQLSICSRENNWCQLYISDKKILSDCKIWMKFLEDNQNTNCLSNIICHLSWKNIDFSKKICKQFVNYLEEYHDNVYESCFSVCRSLLGVDDYIEQCIDKENQKYQIKIFTHIRCDRFLTPTIKMIRDWYRDNKYIQSVAKIAQFIDDLAQNNINVANYFRIKSKDINIQWFQQFLNSHSYYLNLPRPPEFN